MDPKQIVENYAREGQEAVADVAEGLEEAGRFSFKFLKSVWFWIIAGPVNILITLGVVTWAFPFLFVGFPPAPEIIAKAPMAIVVDKDRQAAYAYEYGKLKHRFVVVTGYTTETEDHDTPVGNNNIIWMYDDHHSSEYPQRPAPESNGGAPMPFTMRFTSRGHALHTGFMVGPRWCMKGVLGDPKVGSHGCVNMTLYGSWRLFKWAKKGMAKRTEKVMEYTKEGRKKKDDVVYYPKSPRIPVIITHLRGGEPVADLAMVQEQLGSAYGSAPKEEEKEEEKATPH